MPILDLYFLVRRRESDAVFGSFFVRWLAAVLIALVRMVASGKILTRALRILTSFLTLAVPPSFLLWLLRFLMLPRGMWFPLMLLLSLMMWLWSFLMDLVLWL